MIHKDEYGPPDLNAIAMHQNFAAAEKFIDEGSSFTLQGKYHAAPVFVRDAAVPQAHQRIVKPYVIIFPPADVQIDGFDEWKDGSFRGSTKRNNSWVHLRGNIVD